MTGAGSNRQDGYQKGNVAAAASGESTQHTLARLPNGQWPVGVSGNPKGRKPKDPSNNLDGLSALQQALDKKVTLKEGGKEKRISRRRVIQEQWINQAAKGDHRARSDLIAYCDKHGADLFGGQHDAILVAQGAILSPTVTLNEEVLDRLDETTLEAINKAIEDVIKEAQKTKKLH
jgi:hypothetical protein